jgi:hypothetical protein
VGERACAVRALFSFGRLLLERWEQFFVTPDSPPPHKICLRFS